jgi:diadenosine tetraphosphate (Ap4A) HIT family hydrolase
MAGCMACDLIAGRASLPGGQILRTEHWVVEHCLGPLPVGTLLVKPTRHVLHVGDLTDAEAAELGPLLRDTARVVDELAEPQVEQVYTCLWSHNGSEPVHIHYVVQPATRELFDELGTGPRQQAALFDRGERPDPEAMEAFAARARARFGVRTTDLA